MIVSVRCFAAAREALGATAAVGLSEGATVADLRAAICRAEPDAAGLIGRCAVAVDREFAGDDVVIPDGAEVALLPPVSGG